MNEHNQTEVNTLRQNETPEPPKNIIPDGMALVPIEPDKDAEIIALVQSASSICQWAENRVIANLEDTKAATEDLNVLSLTVKAVKGKQADYTKPYKTLLAGIDAVFKPVLDALSQADGITRKKIQTYLAEVERKRREAEETNRMAEEVARRQAEASGTGEFTVDTTPVEVPPAIPKTIRTDIGSISSVKAPSTWELIDWDMVPKEYKILDSVLIGKVIRAGGSIPGIKTILNTTLRVSPTKW